MKTLYNGKTIEEWSKETGIKSKTICYRLKNGWTIEEVISIPVTKGGSLAKTKYNIIGEIFFDRFGNEYKVICFDHRDKYNVAFYKVRFLNSGYETIACSSQIRRRNNKGVFDRLSPSVHSVGIMGFAYGKDNPKLFNVWRAIIARCYNPKNPSYKTYGAVGITVCERWKRFDYFLDDVKSLPGFNQEKIDNGKLVLDKDCIDRSKKIYSPETCMFVTRSENARESATRTWHNIKCNDYPLE